MPAYLSTRWFSEKKNRGPEEFLGAPIISEKYPAGSSVILLKTYAFESFTMPTFLLGPLVVATQVAGVLVAVVLAYYAICYFTSPLKDIPGPSLAKFTNLWRVHDYIHLISPETQKKLHAKHGVAVRLGPNLVALNDPALIPVIYNARGTFRKVRNSLISWECRVTSLEARTAGSERVDYYTVAQSLHANHLCII